ncbi:MAG: hypothetical protein RMJ37_00250 [Spirochaetia bacterium]|nr:hypothetical protein [Spirochaetota bacterium]MCX8097046.1 hypothetical protein [Spirochaetota bacterium]MDW8111759.1 hypothetical protein [Spirochaetia bacterium]
MFIKNITLGIFGNILFPLSYLLTNNSQLLIYGLLVSFSLILFYFVNVYVIGKRRTFFTITSSWVMILSLALPVSFLLNGDTKTILQYIGISSLSLGWFMTLYETIASQTFKGH